MPGARAQSVRYIWSAHCVIAPQEVNQAIQYAFFVHENRFVEVDFKRDVERMADFRGFARDACTSCGAVGALGEKARGEDAVKIVIGGSEGKNVELAKKTKR